MGPLAEETSEFPSSTLTSYQSALATALQESVTEVVPAGKVVPFGERLELEGGEVGQLSAEVVKVVRPQEVEGPRFEELQRVAEAA